MHFTYLVIGDEPEKLLAPYYSQPDNHDPNCPLVWKFENATHDLTADSEEELHLLIEENGYNLESLNQDEIYWFNPQSVWDWYVIGGRWEGFFNTLDGGTSDQLLKNEINFDLENREALLEKHWDEAQMLFGEEEVHLPKFYYSYQNFDDYQNQNRVKLFRQARLERGIGFGDSPTDSFLSMPIDDYCYETKEAFIKANLYNHVMTAGLIKQMPDNKTLWLDRYMDSHSIDDQSLYKEKWLEAVNEADDDALFTLIDCHN